MHTYTESSSIPNSQVLNSPNYKEPLLWSSWIQVPHLLLFDYLLGKKPHLEVTLPPSFHESTDLIMASIIVNAGH